MGLTREVDLKLLHKCFEIETYDCLLKPEYMDAMKSRRQHIVAQRTRAKENAEIAAKRLLKETTMRCNIVAQRSVLQEHFSKQADDIMKQLDDLAQNDEEAKNLNFANVRKLIFDPWLEGFKLENPTDYFKDQPENTDLVCNVLTELQFLMKTLELFGLPEDYINGNGHWATWTRESAEGKDKKKGKGKKDVKKKQNIQILKMFGKQKEQVLRPTHFDLAPF